MKKLWLIAVVILTGVLIYVAVTDPPVYSENVTIVSTDEAVARINDNVITVLRGTQVNQLSAILQSSDNSKVTIVIANNEGSEKSLPMLYDFDQVIVTAEDRETVKAYQVRLVDDFE